MKIKEEYLNQSGENPKYIFHGSTILSDILDPQKAHDKNNNEKNENNLFEYFKNKEDRYIILIKDSDSVKLI